MGLDVKLCCRLCLADSASENATQIDVQQQREVGELVEELYALNVGVSDRGSRFVCVPCYRNAANLKKYLDQHRTKAKLVSVNQSILVAQVEAYLEKQLDETEDDLRSEPRTGYRPPSSTPAEMLLTLEDCMRCTSFRETLQNPYELGHLRLSGPIYQEDTDSFAEFWHPNLLYCTVCKHTFEDAETFDDHKPTCKYRCVYCKRKYALPESAKQHVCPAGDKYKRSKRLRMLSITDEPRAKRAKTVDRDSQSVPRAEAVEATPVVSTSANSSTFEDNHDNDSLKLVPMPTLLPAPAEAPHIEGEASLDAELSNLLERWYGHTEDIEELNHLNLEAVEEVADENGSITNADLHGRIIDMTYQQNATPRRPAISVKPMSQLIGTSAPPPLAVFSSAIQTPSDVIEIDDDDDVVVQNSTAVPQSASSVTRPDGQALSQTDILNIVKHFRGIDENESYLIKAKINGAQKLICISKRKGEGNSQSRNASSIVNNNSALQSGSRKPTLITPASRQQQLATHSTPSSHMKTKIVSDKNGTSDSGVPQIKIAHVQSLGQNTQMLQNQTGPRRIHNGKQTVFTPQSTVNHQKTTVQNIASPSPASMKRLPTFQQSTANNATTQPRRIIVGSNSIKLLNASDKTKIIDPLLQQTTGVVSNSSTTTTTTSTQQRIVVQRKQVQTIIHSSVRRTTGSSTQVSNASSNELLRTHLLQQPRIVYPGANRAPQNGNNAATDSSRKFQLNNTTITRID
ncbi:uncharacterized protein LOC129771164 isoform X2 [Toxorhynchites rutilus septentrionalis]|uniref:uncharacterized protein LOC129771164 isoform X2 n=1 Tax=Toxorhynchites rutilus septentrionalis TaxID=329112 RepID=UPI002479EB90|nr:uncharacterized protein LOC129771164 isoform X2 [Toxorhynchites rutilus septentrionalis]